jgi:hypothetical protein
MIALPDGVSASDVTRIEGELKNCPTYDTVDRCVGELIELAWVAGFGSGVSEA